MKPYRVQFSRIAIAHLAEIYAFIADRDGIVRAENYVSKLQKKCELLGLFPIRGTPRDDLRPGLRTVCVAKRATVAYTIDSASKAVVIHGIFTGGRDIDSAFKGD